MCVCPLQAQGRGDLEWNRRPLEMDLRFSLATQTVNVTFLKGKAEGI